MYRRRARSSASAGRTHRYDPFLGQPILPDQETLFSIHARQLNQAKPRDGATFANRFNIKLTAIILIAITSLLAQAEPFTEVSFDIHRSKGAFAFSHEKISYSAQNGECTLTSTAGTMNDSHTETKPGPEDLCRIIRSGLAARTMLHASCVSAQPDNQDSDYHLTPGCLCYSVEGGGDRKLLPLERCFDQMTPRQVRELLTGFD